MPTLIIRPPRLQSPNSSPSRSQSQSQSQSQSHSHSRSPSPIPFGASPLVTTPTEMSHREAGALSSEEEEEEDHLARLRRRLTRTKQKAKSVRREPRWQKLLSEWGLLLTLENAGSVARDHLASERTFLAYARTSLTISSTGVALVQLFTLSAQATNSNMERFARPLGAVMIGLGIYTLSVGVLRYFLVQQALVRGVYPVARVGLTMLAGILVVVVVVVFVIILVAR